MSKGKALCESYVELLKKRTVYVERGLYVLSDEEKQKYGELANELLKDKDYQGYITAEELLWELTQRPATIFEEKKDKLEPLPKDGQLLEDVCKGKDCIIKTLATETFNFIKAQKDTKHRVYIKLPLDISYNMPPIQLTETSSIIKLTQATELPNLDKKTDWTNAGIFEGRTYVKIITNGYGNAARSEAISIFKCFAYIASSTKTIQSDPYARTTHIARTYGTAEDRLIAFSYDTSNNVPWPLYPSSELMNYISGMKHIEIACLLGVGADLFKQKMINFIKLFDPSIKENVGHIRTAIEWGFDGEANPNQTFGFIQTCIGLEALLGYPNLKDTGVTEKLSNRVADILGETTQQRKDYKKEFRKIYQLRSKLVHGSQAKLADKDAEQAERARGLLRQLISHEITGLINTSPTAE